MSDFFDSFIGTGTSIINNIVDGITIVRNPEFEHFNAAQRVFGTAGEKGFTSYNLPKLKYSFIVEFVLSPFAKNFIETQLPDTHTGFNTANVSCMVRDTSLPSFSFHTEKVNQYNKQRVITGEIDYKPVMMSFYDTVDGAAYLLLDAYRKYYYGDFFAKSPAAFRNDVLSSSDQFEMTGTNWGRSVMNNGNYDSQYFFQQINIYEIDSETYTVHNMFNAFISDFTPDVKTMESEGEPSILSLTLEYEGCGNLNQSGYQSIAVPTVEIASLIMNTSGLGKSGFFKFFGELDDKSHGLTTIGKIIRATTAGHDIISSVKDIIHGDFNPDTIRNIGSAISSGADAIGLGSVVGSANEKFGLGNILGDF